MLTDDLDCALPLLELAVRQVPERPEFNYHRGAALVKANHKARTVQ